MARRPPGQVDSQQWADAVRALVLAVLLGHAALMASAWCAMVMGPQHGDTTGRALSAPGQNAVPMQGERAGRPALPPAPRQLPGTCPAQQTLPPLVLLLLLLGVALGWLWTSALPTTRVRPARAVSLRAPPLPARQRRALLQVFLI